MAPEWYYCLNGQKVDRPVPMVELRSLAISGALQPTDLVWREGLAEWVQATQIKGLFPDAAALPPTAIPSFTAAPPLVRGPQPPPWTPPAAAPPRRHDLDDYEDDRPRRRRRKKAGLSGAAVVAICGGILGVLLMIGLVGVGVYFGVTAASDSKQALKFNDQVVQGQLRFAKVSKEFEEIARPANLGLPVNVPQLKTKYQEVRSVLAALRAEANSMYVPTKPSARRFHTEYKNFLSLEDEVLNEVDKFMPLLENPTPNNAARAQQLFAKMANWDAKEKQASQAVINAQRDFAKDYNIKLLPSPVNP